MITNTFKSRWDGKEYTLHIPETPKECAQQRFDMQLPYSKPMIFNSTEKNCIEYNNNVIKYWKIHGRRITKETVLKREKDFLDDIKLESMVNMRYDERIEFYESVIAELEKIDTKQLINE